MSYNIRNGIGIDNIQDIGRIARVILREAPDLVALQELDSATLRVDGRYIPGELGRMTGMHAPFGRAIGFAGGSYGIGLLSRTEPLAVRSIPLPGREEARVLLMAEFPDYTVCITHLSLTPEDRLASLPIIREATDTCRKPVLLAGDFNTGNAAAGLAGLCEVPCLLVSVDDQDAGLLALVENLQRRDLDYLEQAEGLQRLMQEYHLTQEQAARRLGKSQPAVANKLRLLRLSSQVRAALRVSGLSERHARALLRLEDETAQLRAIRLIAENDWTVARTERYVDEQLSAAKGKARLSRFVLRDMRLFLNGINHQLDLIRAAGLNPQTEQEETERELVLTIRIPKSVSGR